jgi:hypothetical protein
MDTITALVEDRPIKRPCAPNAAPASPSAHADQQHRERAHPITSCVAATLNHEGVENPRSGTWTVAGVVSILRRLDRWERAGVEPVAA